MRLVPCDPMEPWGTLAHHMGLNGGIRVVNTGNMEVKDMVFPGQAEPAIKRGSFWCVYGVNRASWSGIAHRKEGEEVTIRVSREFTG